MSQRLAGCGIVQSRGGGLLTPSPLLSPPALLLQPSSFSCPSYALLFSILLHSCPYHELHFASIVCHNIHDHTYPSVCQFGGSFTRNFRPNCTARTLLVTGSVIYDDIPLSLSLFILCLIDFEDDPIDLLIYRHLGSPLAGDSHSFVRNFCQTRCDSSSTLPLLLHNRHVLGQHPVTPQHA